MKWGIRILGVLLALAIMAAFTVTAIERWQLQKNTHWINTQQSANPKHSPSADIVYSRSGNTAILASHIAN